ncbi:MAG: hypothetical protein JJT94_07965 [Bernardetiaceae bacterium]|nr:hypothetical protein [Bernardetiaceae bacterium]
MTLDQYIAEAFKDDFIAQGVEIGRAEEKLRSEQRIIQIEQEKIQAEQEKSQIEQEKIQAEQEKVQQLNTAIRNMLKIGSFSLEVIAGILEVEIERVQQVHKEWQKEQQNSDEKDSNSDNNTTGA